MWATLTVPAKPTTASQTKRQVKKGKKKPPTQNGGGRRRGRGRRRRRPPAPRPALASPPPMPLTLRARRLVFRSLVLLPPRAVTMPSWWKRSKSAFHRSPVTPFSSASTPSSPARASTSCVQPGGRAGRRDLLAPPKLTRQRKLRHVDDLYVALGDLRVDVSDRSSSSSPPQQRRLATASEAIEIPVPTLVSRSASAREGGAPPPRSASSPVLHPLPLPSPRPPDPSGAGAADGWCDRTTHAPRCGPYLPFLRKKSPFFFFRPISSDFKRLDIWM
jgi:hypothetical protein